MMMSRLAICDQFMFLIKQVRIYHRIDQELAYAAAERRGRRFMLIHQVAPLVCVK